MILSADELLVALQATLTAHLGETIETLVADHGWTADDFPPIREYQQLPTIEALSTADLPAVALSSPGLVGDPKFSRADRAHHATWRLSVGVFDRGRDHAHIQAKLRRWCSAVRFTVRAHPTLGGVATSTTWRSERYDLKPNREQARTFGTGAVFFDVSALVLDSLAIGPAVSSTPTPSVSVQ